MGKKLGGFDSLFQDKPVEEKPEIKIRKEPAATVESNDDLTIVRTFRVKKSTAQALKIAAAKHDLKMGETIDAAVELYFQMHPELT